MTEERSDDLLVDKVQAAKHNDPLVKLLLDALFGDAGGMTNREPG